MGANKTPIDKSITKEKAIKQGGYYNTDGDWNNIMVLDEYPGKIFRGRVEVLILKDGKLFMFLKENGKYRIPGGGFDKGVLNKDQAFIETKEEAKMIIQNVRYTGVTYSNLYDEIWPCKEGEIPYDGNYNEVYIADYKEDYVGYIRKGLSDMELTNKGKFYDLKDVENILKEPHKQALMNMLNNAVIESAYEDPLIESIQHLQKILHGLHTIFDTYHCIQNRDIESDDGGYIFAEYMTSTPNEITDLKSFIGFCNNEIKKNVYTGYIEEPASYKGHGFLFAKNNTLEESSYVIDENCIDDNSKEFLIEASQNIKKGKYPVFIINSFTGTTFGTLISLYTHSYYSHSSLSLDTSLDNLYSFDKDGFVKESIQKFVKKNEDARIQVKCLFVKKNDIKVIKERLDYLWSMKDRTKYAIDNIINIIFNKPMETAKDSMSLVCSQFVTWILSFADIKLLDKSINLITPKDLSNLESPKLYLLYEGLAKEYDKKKIDKVFKKLKDKAQLIK